MDVNWEAVARYDIITRNLQSWIDKKIQDIFGEPEESLVDFVCAKLRERTAPAALEEELVAVLDSDCGVFVVKLWRLLIFTIRQRELTG